MEKREEGRVTEAVLLRAKLQYDREKKLEPASERESNRKVTTTTTESATLTDSDNNNDNNAHLCLYVSKIPSISYYSVPLYFT